MSDLKTAIDELVIANRILAAEKVCDAFGHVSMRHPDDPSKFLLSRGRAPELIQASDIMQDGTQDPTKTCDGISIGIGFEARVVQLGAAGYAGDVNVAEPLGVLAEAADDVAVHDGDVIDVE